MTRPLTAYESALHVALGDYLAARVTRITGHATLRDYDGLPLLRIKATTVPATPRHKITLTVTTLTGITAHHDPQPPATAARVAADLIRDTWEHYRTDGTRP